MRFRIVLIAVVLVAMVGVGAGYLVWSNNIKSGQGISSTRTSTTGSSTTSGSSTFVEPFYYPIAINYTGSWNLVYWGQNGTYGTHEGTISVGGYGVLYNFKRSMNGSGDWQATMTTYAVGYEQETLCAQATKLDSQDLTLTLAIGGPPYYAHVIGGLPTINSTTASDPSAEVCLTIAV